MTPKAHLFDILECSFLQSGNDIYNNHNKRYQKRYIAQVTYKRKYICMYIN